MRSVPLEDLIEQVLFKIARRQIDKPPDHSYAPVLSSAAVRQRRQLQPHQLRRHALPAHFRCSGRPTAGHRVLKGSPSKSTLEQTSCHCGLPTPGQVKQQHLWPVVLQLQLRAQQGSAPAQCLPPTGLLAAGRWMMCSSQPCPLSCLRQRRQRPAVGQRWPIPPPRPAIPQKHVSLCAGTSATTSAAGSTAAGSPAARPPRLLRPAVAAEAQEGAGW
jgi:hypothetical protein